MRYKDQIRPELRPIAQTVPFNRAVIACAGLALPLGLALTRPPEGIPRRLILPQGNSIYFMKIKR